MNNKFFNKLIYGIIVAIVYIILSPFFTPIQILGIFVVCFILYIIYDLKFNKDFFNTLEQLCDPQGFIEMIEEKYVAKEKEFADLYLAYGYVYIGEFEKAKNLISQYQQSDLNEINENVWFDIKFKIAFNNKDKEAYMNLIDQFKSIEPSEYRINEIAVVELTSYIFDERYQELREGLLEIIPLQAKRIRIMELEYLLAIAHNVTGELEDALAVLEFVVKKDYGIIYTKYCNELLQQLEN